MKINLQGKNFEITPAISDYVEKRVTNLSKLLSAIEAAGGEILINFEVGKNSEHHKSGDVFISDCNVKIDGKNFHYSSQKEDLYQSIDEVKESLYEEIRRFKERRQTLFRRGALSVKKMLKGLSDRNPFTSKY